MDTELRHDSTYLKTMDEMGQDHSGSIRRTRMMALAWTAIILMFGILPLSDYVGHSHWEYIKWVPTLDDLRSLRYLLDIGSDIVGNTLLFVPFGYLLVFSTGEQTKKHFLLIGGAAAVLSCSIEFFQVYCHSRFPSVLDVVTNVTGSLIGVAMTNRFRWGFLGVTASLATPIPPDRTLAP
jgi:glycopeptide antibiotics resistance protein